MVAYLLTYFPGPTVIGHSCCSVPANVLSVCLFVFFGKANKIEKKVTQPSTSKLSDNPEGVPDSSI